MSGHQLQDAAAPLSPRGRLRPLRLVPGQPARRYHTNGAGMPEILMTLRGESVSSPPWSRVACPGCSRRAGATAADPHPRRADRTPSSTLVDVSRMDRPLGDVRSAHGRSRRPPYAGSGAPPDRVGSLHRQQVSPTSSTSTGWARARHRRRAYRRPTAPTTYAGSSCFRVTRHLTDILRSSPTLVSGVDEHPFEWPGRRPTCTSRPSGLRVPDPRSGDCPHYSCATSSRARSASGTAAQRATASTGRARRPASLPIVVVLRTSRSTAPAPRTYPQDYLETPVLAPRVARDLVACGIPGFDPQRTTFRPDERHHAEEEIAAGWSTPSTGFLARPRPYQSERSRGHPRRAADELLPSGLGCEDTVPRLKLNPKAFPTVPAPTPFEILSKARA